MIIITYRPLYCVFALKLGIPSRKFLAPPLARAQQGAQELDRAVVSGERIAVRLSDKKHITTTSE